MSRESKPEQKKDRCRDSTEAVLINTYNTNGVDSPVDKNKDRVPFYMSIPTTMKFIVRGKSVDFLNHEGSSPSIPKKARLNP